MYFSLDVFFRIPIFRTRISYNIERKRPRAYGTYRRKLTNLWIHSDKEITKRLYKTYWRVCWTLNSANTSPNVTRRYIFIRIVSSNRYNFIIINVSYTNDFEISITVHLSYMFFLKRLYIYIYVHTCIETYLLWTDMLYTCYMFVIDLLSYIDELLRLL